MDPTPERFLALARSSPWRWVTLRFTLSHRAPHQSMDVRAWVRRPDRARVEDLAGNLIQVVQQPPAMHTVLTDDLTTTYASPLPWDLSPVVDGDGLVRQRPSAVAIADQDPMFRNYHWIAMLDPVELADGLDGTCGSEVDELATVIHHGRRAWQAVVRPTLAYNPRCPCCPLLFSEVSDRLDGGPTARTGDPALVFPWGHRIRLDVATGVCVHSEQLGGTRTGATHDVSIEAVDEPMTDQLFRETHRPPSARPSSWRLRPNQPFRPGGATGLGPGSGDET